ncbi:hypothetical protein GQ44DRAFT_385638 [Phaeosphaeriaceae sp. PMI808]|nr:hypothetical protein GQ44DRAFT_385638 [Phaeosphaeriaceae sp. PMI808]
MPLQTQLTNNNPRQTLLQYSPFLPNPYPSISFQFQFHFILFHSIPWHCTFILIHRHPSKPHLLTYTIRKHIHLHTKSCHVEKHYYAHYWSASLPEYSVPAMTTSFARCGVSGAGGRRGGAWLLRGGGLSIGISLLESMLGLYAVLSGETVSVAWLLLYSVLGAFKACKFSSLGFFL